MTFIPYESFQTFEPFCHEMDNKALHLKETFNKGVINSEIPSIESKYNLDLKKALTLNVT
jgi:hypothetical protein